MSSFISIKIEMILKKKKTIHKLHSNIFCLKRKQIAIIFTIKIIKRNKCILSKHHQKRYFIKKLEKI